MNLFRNLTKEEVEVRAARYKNGKAELLLYKTSRTDCNLLDEQFGPYGWATQYKTEKDMLFCGVALFDKETKTWVWKWSNGSSEANFEKEKSNASDALKRCCFLWGLGRELYSAPKIIVPCENEYETWTVDELGYDGKDRITELVISDSKGKTVFSFHNGKKERVMTVDPEELLQTVCAELKAAGEDYKELGRFYNYYKDRLDRFDNVSAKTINTLWSKWNKN